ncbi:MAG: transcriptional repressor LexA [Carboxydocellales bacterium]
MELSKEAVGKKVKEARDIKSRAIGYRYTQGMLAKDTSTSQGYISDIENGRSYPSTPLASAIANTCGVSMDFITGKEKKDPQVNKPEALQKIKDSFSEILDIVYLPVIGHIPAGLPLLVEETIETYLPYPKEYDPERHFVLRVQGDSMKDAGILDGDLVVIRQQPAAENGQIVAIRLKDDGVTLKKFYQENEGVQLRPCNDNYNPIVLNDNATIVGIAVSVTKKLV